MPDNGADLFHIPENLDPKLATDRAQIIILTSATLADLLASHLCNACPPDKPQLDSATSRALIAAYIRSFMIYLAITRYTNAASEDAWANTVKLQLEAHYPAAWHADLEPFMAGVARTDPQQVAALKQKLVDPFGPYRGSTLDHIDEDLMGSAFGRLLRVVIPALYTKASQPAAGKQLLELAARGTRAFLADVCNA